MIRTTTNRFSEEAIAKSKKTNKPFVRFVPELSGARTRMIVINYEDGLR